MHFHGGTSRGSLASAVKDMQARCCGLPHRLETDDKETQTDYRESEAQTSPWTPPYKLRPNESPEVLTLKNLTWGHGLPAGMHEIEMINRTRMKRAWESILPPMDSPSNVKIASKIISAMEMDDWAFRDAEIQFIMDMRMELMEEMTRAREEAAKKKAEELFLALKKNLEEQRDKKINDIRRELGRDLRKLAKKYSSKSGKDEDLIKKYDLTRVSLDSRLTKLKNCATRDYQFSNRRMINTGTEQITSRLLPGLGDWKKMKSTQKPLQLCDRVTRWTDDKLKQLHTELRDRRINRRSDRTSNSKKRIPRFQPPLSSTLAYERSTDDKKAGRAATLVQKLVRDGSVQCTGKEGGKVYSLEERSGKRCECPGRAVSDVREENVSTNTREDRLNAFLRKLRNSNVVEALDSLNKELVRLRDERKAHALKMLAERAESLRDDGNDDVSEKELQNDIRKESDEMFGEMMNVDEGSVVLYLENVVNESNSVRSSENEARECLEEVLDRANERFERLDERNNEKRSSSELVTSDVISSDLESDEVAEDIGRGATREESRTNLRFVREILHDHLSDLPVIVDSQVSDTESETREERVEQTPGTIRDDPSEISEISRYDESIREEKSTSNEEWIRQEIIEDVTNIEGALIADVLDDLITRAMRKDAGEIVEDLIDDVIMRVGSSVRSSLSDSSSD